MLYQFQVNISEEDYLAFNYFQSFDSVQGKKLIRKSQRVFVLIMVILMALTFLINGFSTFAVTYAILLGLFTAFYMAIFRKIMKRNIRKHLDHLKKTGKLPYDPVSTIEFHQDHLVEITPSKRTEHGYDAMERICVLGDRYIFLYYSSVGAYILPIPQLRAQANPEELLGFLTQKCGTVEHY